MLCQAGEVNRPPILVEICVDSVESALAAQRGGAHQVELCADLLEGGITPSAGMIEEVRTRTTLPLQVMIRPRGGDFLYSSPEIEVIKRDIRMAKESGASGITLGLLMPDGTIDKEHTAALVELAKPLPVTFHRAFDMVADPVVSLEDLVLCGIRCVLTSGGAPFAEQGHARLRDIVHIAGSRIEVMVCGGIRHHNVAQILQITGAKAIHANPQVFTPSPMTYRNNQLSLSADSSREFQRAVVNEDEVRLLMDALQSVMGSVDD